MKNAIRWLCIPAILLAGTAACLSGQDGKTDSSTAGNANAASVELTGKLAPFSPGTSRTAAFKTESGAVYTLVSNRMSLALFTDTNLHGRTLLLKGVVSAGPRFEVTGNLRSIRDGKIHELYYYCDICAIKGSDPGPCTCCREPVHLVEAMPGSEVH